MAVVTVRNGARPVDARDRDWASISFKLGLCATTLMFLGSFGGGSLQKRGSALEWFGLEFLSFGHGAALSNVTLWVGTTTLVIAWLLLGKAHADVAVVRRIVLWWLAPLAAAAPMMSRDVYSYLMQGSLLRDGFDAYTQGPSANPNAILFEVSHDWRNTTTPYGPLHLWIGEGVTRVVGDNVLAGTYMFKLISLLGFAAIIWAVPKIAQQLGADPGFALWLGVANPVMIIHMVGGMHNESVMVGLVSIGLWLALRSRNGGEFFFGIALIAVAMSLKATAAFCLPFVVWIWVNKAPTPAQKWVAFFVAAIGGAVLTVAIVALITSVSGASWGWIAALTGNAKVINPLSFPSFVAGHIANFGKIFFNPFPFNDVVAVTRKLSMLVMAGGFVACWWFFRSRPIIGTTVMCMVMFTFNAVTLPWYYASVLSLVGTFSSSRYVKQFVVAASVVVALAFTGSGNHQLYNPLWMATFTLIGWVGARWLFPRPTSGTELAEHSSGTHP